MRAAMEKDGSGRRARLMCTLNDKACARALERIGARPKQQKSAARRSRALVAEGAACSGHDFLYSAYTKCSA